MRTRRLALNSFVLSNRNGPFPAGWPPGSGIYGLWVQNVKLESRNSTLQKEQGTHPHLECLHVAL